jgi:hypothetical protein
MQPLFLQAQNFREERVSVKKAISILAKDNICVNEEEASIILNFLYLIAKSHNAIGAALDQHP